MKKEDFEDYNLIGLENHINFIHRPKGELSEEEVYGITAILNTSFIDIYFRMLNGNTQVNATDIRSLPLPPLDKIKEIGRHVIKEIPPVGKELDSLVSEHLKIDVNLFH